MKNYYFADPDAEMICAAGLDFEGDGYPYNDDRYTLSPVDFYRNHYDCGHPESSPIGRILKEIREVEETY